MNHDQSEVDQQLLDLIDGTDVDPDVADRLMSDPDARARYLDLVALQVLLVEKLEVDAQTMPVPEKPSASSHRRNWIRWAAPVATTALAVCVLVVLVWQMNSTRMVQEDPNTPIKQETPVTTFVAKADEDAAEPKAGVARRDASLAPTKPLATRVQEADKVFVGVLINRKLLEGDWCHADLKVTQAIKGVKVDELVPVLWRPKIARYDANENQQGLVLLKYSHQNRYWLRSDTFEDAKLAEQAVKFLDGDDSER